MTVMGNEQPSDFTFQSGRNILRAAIRPRLLVDSVAQFLLCYTRQTHNLGRLTMPPLNTFQKTCLAMAVGQLVALPIVEAATITVNTTLDIDGGGPCTLREAITSIQNADIASTGCSYAELFGVDDAIDFDLGLSGQTITLTQATPLNITTDLSINGLGRDMLTIDGNNNSHVFHVVDTVDLNTIIVSLNNMTITGGSSVVVGGIYSRSANISLTNSTVSGNSATLTGGIYSSNFSLSLTNSTVSGNFSSFSGGGIYAGSANISLTKSTVSGNSAANDGGGILSQFGNISLTNSMVSGNYAANDGGGIYASGGTISLTNSTVSGNSAANDGGGISAEYGSSVTLSNSTVSDNSASDTGGGIFITGTTTSISILNTTLTENYADTTGGLRVEDGATVKLTNSIIADNTSNQFFEKDCSNISGTVDNSNGGNLVRIDSAISPCGVFSIENQDPLLGPLQNNGGPTKTHALLVGSPAVNTAENGFCPAKDQRGENRSDGKCDIGAYEFIDDSCFVVKAANGKAAVFCL